MPRRRSSVTTAEANGQRSAWTASTARRSRADPVSEARFAGTGSEAPGGPPGSVRIVPAYVRGVTVRGVASLLASFAGLLTALRTGTLGRDFSCGSGGVLGISQLFLAGRSLLIRVPSAPPTLRQRASQERLAFVISGARLSDVPALSPPDVPAARPGRCVVGLSAPEGNPQAERSGGESRLRQVRGYVARDRVGPALRCAVRSRSGAPRPSCLFPAGRRAALARVLT